MIHTLTQGHLLPMVAPAAILGRIGRIDFDERSASFFRFARELVKELRPCRVTDAFRETMVMYHPVDLEVFDADHAEAVNDLAALLMGEVLTSERDPLMDTGNRLAMLAPLRSTLCQSGVLALHLCQRLFFFTEEARVLNLSGIREGGKGFESHVNTDLSIRWLKAFRLAFYGEAHVPLARRRARNGTGFDLPFDLAVIDHLDAANFREADTMIMGDAKPRLREGETIVAVGPTEARVSWVLTRLAAAEEGFEGEVNADCNVLQHLGMHTFQRGALLFQKRESLLLLIEQEGLACLLIGGFAYFQQVIIQPTALRKRLVELMNLFLRWGDSVLVGFTHIGSIAQSRTDVEGQEVCPTHAPNKERPFIPCLKTRGFLGRSCKIGQSASFTIVEHPAVGDLQSSSSLYQ